MNIYKKKIRWKFVLLLFAIVIGIGSLYYTNNLVKKLANEERKKVELWAEATSLIPKSDENLDFLFSVIQSNESVPVILVDSDTNIMMFRNLDTLKVVSRPNFLEDKLASMMAENPAIEIPYLPNRMQYIYYSRSIILNKLIIYPYVQLGIILLFILLAYFAFSYSRKAEQNQVWVGLSKETAHQLGTPISSLMAWVEILKSEERNAVFADELEKDVGRLSKITERFSKIGSQPVLSQNNVVDVVEATISYLKSRSSNKIQFVFENETDGVIIPMNPPLFEWVIENVCKNAMDAVEGEGEIRIRVSDISGQIQIDIKDNGKGIPKAHQKTIFKPGYTTKARGWGLGLSLTKRIVEEYHQGRIFVADSEMGKGTTFRILLKRRID